MAHRNPWAVLALLVACTGGEVDDAVDTDTDTDTFHDPIARPAVPTVSLDAFASANDCAVCHPTHAEEWSTSMHAYAMIDPVYRKLVALRQTHFEGRQDQFCTSCHTPIGTRSGDVSPGFTFEGLQPLSLEGVTCETCHKIASVERASNAGHVLDADGPLRGPIEDPVSNVFHESAYSELHSDSKLCGSCHDVIETSGLNLERPYEEWLESPAPEAGTTCQTCHMPAFEGPAADGGPTRTLHRHTFVGVDLPLARDFVDEVQRDVIREDVQSLLAQSATLLLAAPTTSLAGDQVDVVVTVFNDIVGHNFPTGSTFNRQWWIELVAQDAEGNVLFETGTLDDQGDLRNYWSELDPFGDDDLIVLSSQLTDLDGDPELFTWSALEHTSPSIAPLQDRTWTLFVPTTEQTPGPVTVTARLLFRQLPPYLLRELGLDDLLDRLEIHEVSTDVLEVSLD